MFAMCMFDMPIWLFWAIVALVGFGLVWLTTDKAPPSYK